MKHINNSELKQHNKVNKWDVYATAKEYLTFMQQYKCGYFRLLLFPGSTGAPCPLWSIADRRLGRRWAMAHWNLITVGQGDVGCSITVTLSLEGKTVHVTNTIQYNYTYCKLQSSIQKIEKPEFSISLNSETWPLKAQFNTTQVIHLRMRSSLCLLLDQYHFPSSQHSSLACTTFCWHLLLADHPSGSDLCKLCPYRQKTLLCTQLLPFNGSKIRP